MCNLASNLGVTWEQRLYGIKLIFNKWSNGNMAGEIEGKKKQARQQSLPDTTDVIDIGKSRR